EMKKAQGVTKCRGRLAKGPKASERPVAQCAGGGGVLRGAIHTAIKDPLLASSPRTIRASFMCSILLLGGRHKLYQPNRQIRKVYSTKIERNAVQCVRHLLHEWGCGSWRAGRTSIGDALNSALRWRARLETAKVGLPYCGWRMTTRTPMRGFADQ